uniref:Uncharacterized protein LOC100176835 n=1 Tax=Phallusia mammillata TaxID=59560 RepID=A0A6F9DH33_9ASCI|nr:uncharacterized protein LOC100176835 [Phallusia mammillata]
MFTKSIKICEEFLMPVSRKMRSYVVLNGFIFWMLIHSAYSPPICKGNMHWINGTCQLCPHNHFYFKREGRCEKCPKGFKNPNGQESQCQSTESDPEVIQNIPTTGSPPIQQSSIIITSIFLYISTTLIPASTSSVNSTNTAVNTSFSNKNSTETSHTSDSYVLIVCICATFVGVVVIGYIVFLACKKRCGKNIPSDPPERLPLNGQQLPNAP